MNIWLVSRLPVPDFPVSPVVFQRPFPDDVHVIAWRSTSYPHAVSASGRRRPQGEGGPDSGGDRCGRGSLLAGAGPRALLAPTGKRRLSRRTREPDVADCEDVRHGWVDSCLSLVVRSGLQPSPRSS